MRGKLLLGIGIAVATNSHAAWVPSATSAGEVSYLQRESISPRGKLTKAWFLINYEKPKYVGGSAVSIGEAYRSVMSLMLVDCAERRIGIAQTVFYSEPSGGGTSVSHQVKPDALVQLDDVVPGSTGEMRLEQVCALRTGPH